MVRFAILSGAALVALSACSSAPPVSNPRGVGFDDYAQYELRQARAEAGGGQLAVSTATPLVPPSQSGGLQGGPIGAGELAAAGIGQSGSGAPVGAPIATAAGAPLATAAGAPAPLPASDGAISDEQNFDAVSGERTIESDADRLARIAAGRTEVAPTALPSRTGSDGPNIVAFALGTTHARGTPVYSRSGLSGERRFQRNCAEYISPDDAQRDFLARGGPERDRLGIDPDGDGFACGWDPAPFRLVRESRLEGTPTPAETFGAVSEVETVSLDGGN